MAGRPLRQAIAIELDARKRDLVVAGADEATTELDYVVEWVSSGKTLVKLAEELTKASNLDISREQVRQWLIRQFGEKEVQQRIAAARPSMTHALVEQAVEIADAAPPSRDDVAKAKLQAETRLWIAARLNRNDFGDAAKVQVGVQVNLGSQHLDALRARVFVPALATPAVEPVALAFTSDACHSDTLAIPDAIVEPIDNATPQHTTT